MGADEARAERHHEQPHFEALRRLAQLAQQLLRQRVRVVQQVDGRERPVGVVLALAILVALGGARGALERTLPLGLVAQRGGAVLAERLALLGQPRLARLDRLLLVRVGIVGREVVRAQKKVQRPQAELRVGAEECGGDDVDSLGVAPDAAPVHLDHHVQAVLRRLLRRVREHGDDVVLQRLVQLHVLALEVDKLEVGDDMVDEAFTQRLVTAAKQPEA